MPLTAFMSSLTVHCVTAYHTTRDKQTRMSAAPVLLACLASETEANWAAMA
jgi:hypothetical protein